jgi:hypothetical protein
MPVNRSRCRADLVRRWWSASAVGLFPLLMARPIQASDPNVCSPVEKSTHPLYDDNSLQLQPEYIAEHSGGDAVQVLLRLLLAYPYLLVPGLKVGDTYSVSRLEMYGESLSTPKAKATGLQDWNALLLGVQPFRWGAELALGVYGVLPTATSTALGTREFQLGPALGAIVTHVPHLQLGAIVEFFFSVAGSTANLATAQVQPVIAYHLPLSFFLKSDGIMKFAMNPKSTPTVPMNLHWGHGFTSHLALEVTVEYTITGSDHGDFSASLNANYFDW